MWSPFIGTLIETTEDEETGKSTKQKMQAILETAGHRELELIYAFSRALTREG